MIHSVGRRLRLVFRRQRPSSEADAPTPAAASQTPEVEFVAYGEDALLSGHLRLNGDRLTDMLNDHDEYVLVDVMCERLDDGQAMELKEILVARDELLLVHATGPRGDRQRRQRTRPLPMAVQIGPFHVRGYLHCLPGTDPIASIRRRKTMVPFTEAWIEYATGSVRQRRRVSAVVINRELIDWIVPVADDEVEFPDLPVSPEAGPLLKDFTGQLFG